MLKAEVIKKIAETLKVDPTKFAAAIAADDEQEVTLPELKVFTPAELTTHVANAGADALQTKYEEGKTAGVEMKVKELKTEHGIDFEGKDLSTFVVKYKAHVLKDANLPADDKLDAANTTIEGLRKNISTMEVTHATALQAKDGQIDTLNIRTQVESAIPSNLIPTMKTKDVVSVFMSEHKVVKTDGGLQVQDAAGQVIKDQTTLAAVPLATVMQTYVAGREWLDKTKDGRGAGDDGAGGSTGLDGVTDITTFNDHLVAQGIAVNSNAALAELKKLPKDMQAKLTAPR